VTTSFFTMMRARFHPYGPAKAALEAMSAGHAVEFAPFGIAVNIVVPGGAANTPMVPEGSGFDPATLVQPEEMVPPILWLCSQGAEVTGTRYVAGRWKPDATIDQNRDMTEAPIGWPDLAADPVWPGGKPDE
ncbi:MAG: SDR family oxidoreductase, partial [Pseudomonadota bacterium]